ncbi:hypothetical protein COLO4_07151 [Corchorus olitorius]|uniref:Bulb-type lectin domain-containing protein n=1 Tax=Corchorus olitorius TaxID=93759 RepID=A0A1R3KKZ8_9ROSI|nr:hypothetical protein COLO4_07151 [Corchorus olitorius]
MSVPSLLGSVFDSKYHPLVSSVLEWNRPEIPELDRWTGLPSPPSLLNPTQSWSYSHNTFSISFIPSPSSSNSFLAAITFAGGVPVWTVGGDATVDSGGSLRLLSNGTLHLINGSSAVVWDSGTGDEGVSSASLEEYENENVMLCFVSDSVAVIEMDPDLIRSVSKEDLNFPVVDYLLLESDFKATLHFLDSSGTRLEHGMIC